MMDKNVFNKKDPNKINETPLEDVERILNCTSEDYQFFIDEARRFAGVNEEGEPIKERKQKESSTQIRNFYDEAIIPLQAGNEAKSQIGRLKIMLAYSKGRKNIQKTFFDNMNKLCDALMRDPSEKRVKNFREFMEAYVAYTKLISK